MNTYLKFLLTSIFVLLVVYAQFNEPSCEHIHKNPIVCVSNGKENNHEI